MQYLWELLLCYVHEHEISFKRYMKQTTDRLRVSSWVGHALLSDRTSAVGRLCDGVSRERIGGTFHTLGAAWWGVGSSFMDRGHLAVS